MRGRIWKIVSGGIHAQQVSVREIVSAAICLYPDISLSVCGSWFTETIFEMILFFCSSGDTIFVVFLYSGLLY